MPRRMPERFTSLVMQGACMCRCREGGQGGVEWQFKFLLGIRIHTFSLNHHCSELLATLGPIKVV